MVKFWQKNNRFKTAATLFILCLAAPGILGVFSRLIPRRSFKQSNQATNFREIFPAATFVPVNKDGEVFYYKALSRKKDLIGFVFIATKRGYADNIVTLVGMDLHGTITGIKILLQNETPGIGTRIVEPRAGQAPGALPWFQAQFTGKPAGDLEHSVYVITGATISSKAVIESIKEKAKKVLEEQTHVR